MEILTQGIPPKDWWYEATCGTCGTRARFQAKEAKTSSKDGTVWTTCPTCISGYLYGKFVSKAKPSTSYDR